MVIWLTPLTPQLCTWFMYDPLFTYIDTQKLKYPRERGIPCCQKKEQGLNAFTLIIETQFSRWLVIYYRVHKKLL